MHGMYYVHASTVKWGNIEQRVGIEQSYLFHCKLTD